MSNTHVGFANKTGDYTQQVFSYEKHLQNRLSKENTLSPRSLTAFGQKPSHLNLITPQSNRVNDSGTGHVNNQSFGGNIQVAPNQTKPQTMNQTQVQFSNVL